MNEVVDGGPDDGGEGGVGDVVEVLREEGQRDHQDAHREGLGHGRLGPAGSIQGSSRERARHRVAGTHGGHEVRNT